MSLENLIGEVLDDKYQIDKQLGQGGMGAVYKATHWGTDRPVALKVIMPEFMQEKRFIERFKREAKAAGRLRHPNVVNVTDFGFAQVKNSQIAYLVMEYLDGTTLGGLLEKHKTLPLDLIVDIMEQTCIAVNEAHKLGIVHRDLKPDNIWLEPNGRGGYNVKVLDFGLAQLHDLTPKSPKLIVALAGNSVDVDLEAKTLIENDSQTTNNPSWILDEKETLIKSSKPEIPIEEAKTVANLQEAATIVNVRENTGGKNNQKGTNPLALEINNITQAGTILGTPLYMSPEQCQGNSLDFRTDIYSLGIILYQMLSGKTPFKGSFNKLREQHINNSPPALDKNIPQTISKVVMSALEKDPQKRPVSALAFAEALKANNAGEVPIIRQAISFYRRNFVTFLKTSFLVYAPYLVFYFLLIGVSLSLNNNILPGKVIYFLSKTYWLIGIVTLLIAHSTSLGIFALIVEKTHNTSSDNISLLEALKTYLSNFIKIVITGLKGHFKLLLNYSLYSPIIILENKSSQEALSRSEVLVNKLKPVMIGLQIRSLFVSALTLLAAPITFVFISMFCFLLDEEWARSLLEKGTIKAFIFIPSAFIFLPGLFLILIYPIIAIAQSLFYFKTKLVLGETSLETDFVTQTPLLKNKASKSSTQKRTLAFVSVLVIALVSWLGLKDIALILACTGGFTNVVEALTIVGANANARVDVSLFETEFVTTPLIEAIPKAAEKSGLIEVLLKNGANVNVDNGYGWTPLMEATRQGSLETTKLLITYNAEVNAANGHGQTPLMVASKYGNLSIVKFLLNKNADFNASSNENHTALTLAIANGHNQVAKLLLDKGVSVDTIVNIDDKTETPLTLAAQNDDNYMIESLIKKGADIDYQNTDGQTALMIAVTNNNPTSVKQLLSLGAKTDLKDKKGYTALDSAINKNYLEIAELLKNFQK